MKLSKYYSYLNDKEDIGKKEKNLGEKHISLYTGMPVLTTLSHFHENGHPHLYRHAAL